jgi:hypothetical protein
MNVAQATLSPLFVNHFICRLFKYVSRKIWKFPRVTNSLRESCALQAPAHPHVYEKVKFNWLDIAQNTVIEIPAFNHRPGICTYPASEYLVLRILLSSIKAFTFRGSPIKSLASNN